MKAKPAITTVGPGKLKTVVRRGSDASSYQRSDRGRVSLHNETIEECAKIAESYANRRSMSAHAMAKDIAKDIRSLSATDIAAHGKHPSDFPWWAYV